MLADTQTLFYAIHPVVQWTHFYKILGPARHHTKANIQQKVNVKERLFVLENYRTNRIWRIIYCEIIIQFYVNLMHKLCICD